MRGYRALRETNALGSIGAVKEALTITALGVDKSSPLVFGAGVERAESITRQYLLARLGGLEFNSALLYATGASGSRVVYPMPPEWRQVLRSHGFAVAERRSAFLWNSYVVLFLVYAFAVLVWQLVGSVREMVRPRYRGLGRYAYFDSLTVGTLPQPGDDGRSHDVISWYGHSSVRAGGLDTICHGAKDAARRRAMNVPVVPLPGALPPLTRLSVVTRFIAWGLSAGALAVVDLFRGRWWHAMLLKEGVSAATARLQASSRLARDYLFHNSGWIYRPLWTYEAEKQGSRIVFYFYSTNCEPFKRPEAYPSIPYGWRAMSWPNYLVWDEYQADFVRRAVGDNARIQVVGPIWFHTSAADLPAFSKAIAVFDVTPVRPSFYVTLGLDREYYVPETSVRFLSDVNEAAQRNGYKIVWKRKRRLGANTHAGYRSLVEKLANSGNVVSVDPDISAYRVIESSQLVVSMPFTSTALIAKELGKPSCYYDPTGSLQRDDRAAHGIPIIQGPLALAEWISRCAIGSPPCPTAATLRQR